MKSLSYILDHPKEIFTTKEVAELFNVSRQGVLDWVNRERIEFLAKNKNTIIFTGKQVENFIRSNKEDGRFKSIKDILEDYELPAQRSEK